MQLRERVGGLLVESATCFAGQGYCFALAAFGEQEDADRLAAYLERWLPELNCQYDGYGDLTVEHETIKRLVTL